MANFDSPLNGGRGVTGHAAQKVLDAAAVAAALHNLAQAQATLVLATLEQRVKLVTASEDVSVAPATARADKALRPGPLDECVLALGPGAVLGQECAQG